jgi:hypothetical protein
METLLVADRAVYPREITVIRQMKYNQGEDDLVIKLF